MPRDETWDTGARSFLLSVVRSHAISVVVEWDFFFVWSCLVIKAGFFFFFLVQFGQRESIIPLANLIRKQCSGLI